MACSQKAATSEFQAVPCSWRTLRRPASLTFSCWNFLSRRFSKPPEVELPRSPSSSDRFSVTLTPDSPPAMMCSNLASAAVAASEMALPSAASVLISVEG